MAKKRSSIIQLPEKIKKELSILKRHQFHPKAHEIRTQYRVSKGTMFYMKEYGPRSHVSHVIMKESIKILILTSLISFLGGVGLQSVQAKLATLIPLIILLPALNSLIGDYGIIVSSKFTTGLFMGQIPMKGCWGSESCRGIIKTVLKVALVTSVYIGVVAYLLSILRGVEVSAILFAKVLLVSVFSVLVLFAIIVLISVFMGIRIYKKGEDPNNFLIPISTAVADFGSMILLSVLIILLFA